MRPSASGFMFVGEDYINIAQSLFDAAGFEIKGTFFWCRSNPGVSVSKADFMPAMDFAIQFVKPGPTARTFNYPGEPEGFSWFKSGICGGNERLKNSKGETLHPTQKPEAVIQHLMDLITLPGDLVMDAFMGVGTTAVVAKKTKRKFVGFEMDDEYFAAAKHRVESAL
jgi:DNA modification methylase